MGHFGRVLNHVSKKYKETKILVICALLNLGVAIVIASGNSTSYWVVNGEYWGRRSGKIEAEKVSEAEYCTYTAESMGMIAAGWLLFLSAQIIWYFYMDRVMEATYEHGKQVGDFSGPPVTQAGEEIDEISDGNVTDEENDPTAEIHRTREELDDLQVALAIRASLGDPSTPYQQGGMLPTRVGPATTNNAADPYVAGTVVLPPSDEEMGYQNSINSLSGDLQDIPLDGMQGNAEFLGQDDDDDQESDALSLLDKRK
eukprot:TRINITY_DN5515_c0_g1_i3.p1 TRINITY_DN5515_c0_g1~~TRINITY_DN5515_c0_g1_i3.p1  ORF type:complete len:257 (+),score=81.21 TRINITY_DN5515_c0_g1_i3:139-909(+)